MNTVTSTTAPAPGAVRARFLDLLAAEWMKLRSLRSTPWAFGIGALVVIAINVNAAVADYDNYPNYPEGIKEVFLPIWAMRDAFTLGAGMVLMLAAGSIGALAVVGEYGTGQIRTTFAAVPARRSVLVAKMAVMTAIMTVYGAFVAGASFGVTQAILSGRGVGLPLDHPGALRATAASALLAPVCALIGLGLGALIRHTATTIVTITGVLLLLPALITDRHWWSATLLHALPQGAWIRLIEVGDWPVQPPYPSTITGAWIVYAAWPLAAAALATVVVHRRDL